MATRAHWLLLTLLLVATACSAPVYEYAWYAGTKGDKNTWSSIERGARIALFDASGRCDAALVPTIDAQAPLLAQGEWGSRLTLWTVDDARVRPKGDLVLWLHTNSDHKVLHYAMGGPEPCLWKATPAMDEALTMVGKTFFYAPARPECVRIEEAGQAASAALLEGTAPEPFTIEAAEIGTASAQTLLAWDSSAASTTWFVGRRGTLHVRGDVLQTCFASAAPPRSDTLALVRTPVGRCDVDGRHVRCTSSLGVWEGVTSSTAVSLTMVRRTLGPLDLVDGKPSKSGRFARSVVAVEMAKPRDGRETMLYGTMQQVVRSALSGGDGSVRAVAGDDPDATLHIAVALHDLAIGDLVQRVTTEQTTYEDHKETRPNPAKDAARAAVANADSAVQQAILDFHNRQDQAKAAQETCLNGCAAFGNYAAGCRSGCNVGGAILTIVVDADPGVQQARANLAQARTNEANTPTTIEVPIVLPWSHKKTTYSRSVSVALDVEAKFPSGVRRWSKPMATSVTDFDVVADPRHNVEGHAGSRDIIDRPDSLLPLIAKMIADELGKRVRAGIAEEREERAVAAFESAGHETAKPENRPVDAAAFDVGGARVLRPLQHGSAEMPKGGGSVQLSAILSPPSCILAVAAADDTEAHLKLTTVDGSHADLRGGPTVAVEVCPDEPMADREPHLQLSSPKWARVRWGLFLTLPAKKGPGGAPR